MFQKSFEDLKKQMAEAWSSFSIRLSESHTANLLTEKWRSLTPLQRKVLKTSVVFLISVGFLAFPVYYFSLSSMEWKEFETKRNLSLELLKTTRQSSLSVFRLNQNRLKKRVESVVKKYAQEDFKIKDKRSLFKKEEQIYKVHFDISLQLLNVRQLIQLGTELENLPQVRLDSLTVQENKQFPKHYHTNYQLSAFITQTERSGRFTPKKSPRLKKNRNRPSGSGKTSRKKTSKPLSHRNKSRRFQPSPIKQPKRANQMAPTEAL